MLRDTGACSVISAKIRCVQGMVSLEKVLESSSSICFTIAALSYPPDTSIYYFWSSIFLTVASTLYHTFDHVYPSKEHRPIAEFCEFFVPEIYDL
eukprot:1258093-Amorphochlora_amoeboformis.AAC.1